MHDVHDGRGVSRSCLASFSLRGRARSSRSHADTVKSGSDCGMKKPTPLNHVGRRRCQPDGKEVFKYGQRARAPQPCYCSFEFPPDRSGSSHSTRLTKNDRFEFFLMCSRASRRCDRLTLEMDMSSDGDLLWL